MVGIIMAMVSKTETLFLEEFRSCGAMAGKQRAGV
jgi:hypothetical protein